MANIDRRSVLIGAGATALAAAIPAIPDSSKQIFMGMDLAGSADRSCIVILNHSGLDCVVRELELAHEKIVKIFLIPPKHLMRERSR